MEMGNIVNLKLIKIYGISQVVIHSQDNIDTQEITNSGEIKGLHFKPDLDIRGALFILNEYNKKELEEIYEEGAMTSLIRKGGSTSDLTGPAKIESGLRIVIDAGGTWLKIEKEGKELTTARIDHHGEGRKDPTSATKMVYEIMEKAELLKENPEWLKKFVELVNRTDNLTYLEKKEKIFNEKYFKEKWPRSLYAIASQVPFDTLIKSFKSGEITGPSTILTEKNLAGDTGKIEAKSIAISDLVRNKSTRAQEILKMIRKELFESGKIKSAERFDKETELKGEIGKLKIKVTINDICKFNEGDARQTIKNLNNIVSYSLENNITCDNTSLGKIIYTNNEEMLSKKGEKIKNFIPNNLAFVGTKALGGDTFISWNKKNNSFFINSNHPNLAKIIAELNKIDPGCATDVRGVMVFGKIKNLKEEQFLNIIDPKILENANPDLKLFIPKKIKKLDTQITEIVKDIIPSGAIDDLNNYVYLCEENIKLGVPEISEHYQKRLEKIEEIRKLQMEKENLTVNENSDIIAA